MVRSILARVLVVSCFVLLVLVPAGCGGSGAGGEVREDPTAFADLKGSNWADYLGQEVVVEGVYVLDPMPMLVADPDLLLVNMLMPTDSYLLLGNPNALVMATEDDVGMRVRIRGVVHSVGNPALPDERVQVAEQSREILGQSLFYNPQAWQGEIRLDLTPRLGQFYAVLFSGGGDPANNHIRYWNDLKFMYRTLVETLGVDPDNIVVLYADGTAEDNEMPVDDGATGDTLQATFENLRAPGQFWNTIFLFTTNHGGGFWPDDSRADPHYHCGGISDIGGDEGDEGLLESDFGVDWNGDGSLVSEFSFDETLVAWGDTIRDDYLGNWITHPDINFGRMVIVMEQCFSGGIIEELSMPGRSVVIMAAADEYQVSRARRPNFDYDEFVYHVTCALNGADPDGTVVDADADADGHVTMLEVFNYARAEDVSDEIPQYEDNGDGVPTSGHIVPGGVGSEGHLGASVWLGSSP